jgi:hypothetical protein
MAWDQTAFGRLNRGRQNWIRNNTLSRLSQQHEVLTSLIGTEEEDTVLDEWEAIGHEIDIRTRE